MRFQSEQASIYVQSLSRTITFTGGFYDTEDPVEIAALQRQGDIASVGPADVRAVPATESGRVLTSRGPGLDPQWDVAAAGGGVESSGVGTITVLTQAEYDALAEPDETTLYVVVG